MKSERLLRMIVLVAILLAAGCVKIDIGAKTPEPTVGQQIIDLYKARQAGTISQSEYEQARKKLLDIW